MSKRSTRPDKSTCQRIHAKRRALERYGLQANRLKYAELVRMIEVGRTKFIVHQTHRKSVHLLTTADGQLLVSYDRLRGNITSFLPKELIPQVTENIGNFNKLKEILHSNKNDGDDGSF